MGRLTLVESDMQIEIPEGIGPHEEQELELMLAGTKPVAMFGDSVTPTFDWGEAKWQPYIDEGLFIKDSQVLTKYDIDFRLVYFCQLDQVSSVLELKEIHVDLFGNPRQDLNLDRKIGELLGYEKWQIDAFVEFRRARQRNHDL